VKLQDKSDSSRRIQGFCCAAKILFPDVAEAALRAGAGGYLVKSDAGRDLLAAVTAVIQGKRFVRRTWRDTLLLKLQILPGS